MTYSVESAEDGVYSVTTQTRYNAAGEPLSATQKELMREVSIIEVLTILQQEAQIQKKNGCLR